MREKVFRGVTLNTLNQTAQELVSMINEPRIWCFEGEMGAGKTTLIKAICHALGTREEITSPTFSLVNEYSTQSGATVYHFDFYRIRSIEEVYDIGYEDYFDSGNLCLIEWPSQIESILEAENPVRITITKSSETERDIYITYSLIP